jgi:hypothetical protein
MKAEEIVAEARNDLSQSKDNHERRDDCNVQWAVLVHNGLLHPKFRSAAALRLKVDFHMIRKWICRHRKSRIFVKEERATAV